MVTLDTVEASVVMDNITELPTAFLEVRAVMDRDYPGKRKNWLFVSRDIDPNRGPEHLITFLGTNPASSIPQGMSVYYGGRCNIVSTSFSAIRELDWPGVAIMRGGIVAVNPTLDIDMAALARAISFGAHLVLLYMDGVGVADVRPEDLRDQALVTFVYQYLPSKKVDISPENEAAITALFGPLRGKVILSKVRKDHDNGSNSV
jgi:hypothetical protein